VISTTTHSTTAAAPNRSISTSETLWPPANALVPNAPSRPNSTPEIAHSTMPVR